MQFTAAFRRAINNSPARFQPALSLTVVIDGTYVYTHQTHKLVSMVSSECQCDSVLEIVQQSGSANEFSVLATAGHSRSVLL